jgi:hypothetical protein
MSSRTLMEMFISSYYSKVLLNCLFSMNSHSSPQFNFGFTYIEFSTIRANNFSAFVIFTDTPPSITRCYPHVFGRSAFLFSFFYVTLLLCTTSYYFVACLFFFFFLRISSYFTVSIFYCQTNTDNGSDRSYKLTRSSHFFLLSMSF